MFGYLFGRDLLHEFLIDLHTTPVSIQTSLAVVRSYYIISLGGAESVWEPHWQRASVIKHVDYLSEVYSLCGLAALELGLKQLIFVKSFNRCVEQL